MLQFYLSMLDSQEDKNKFEQIYNSYRKLIYTISYRILKNHHFAEEAVQESFLKIIDNIDKISDAESSKTKNFIAIITRSVAMDIFRKEKKICEKIDSDFVNIEEAIFSPDTLEYVIRNEGYQKLLDVLEDMDYTYKDTLKLKIIYYYSNEEIAKIQSITKRAVEMRVHRGRKILKELLSKEGLYAE